MPRGALVRWLAAFTVGLPMGCSLLLDSDGLIGDRGVDGGDASLDNDGGSVRGDAGTCEGPNAFCDDFDGDDAPRPEWSRVNTLGGSIALDQALTTSPPNSLHVVAPMDGGGRATGLVKDLPVTRRAVLTADLQCISGRGGNTDFLAVELGTSERSLYAGLVWKNDEFVFEVTIDPDPDGDSDETPIGEFPMNAWKRVEIDVDLTRHQAILRLDGYERTAINVPTELVASGAAKAHVGAFFSTGISTSFSMFFDDVAFRTE